MRFVNYDIVREVLKVIFDDVFLHNLMKGVSNVRITDC